MVHRKKIFYSCKNCKSTFTPKELKTRFVDYGGVKMLTKVCPHCGSQSWSSIEDRKELGKYIFPNM